MHDDNDAFAEILIIGFLKKMVNMSTYRYVGAYID